MSPKRRFKKKRSSRGGAAVVEFALLLPLLCTVTLGMMEIGRGAMVSKIVSDAARNGAQVAALPTSSNATVTSRINSVLTASNITAANATITILVNDVVADVLDRQSQRQDHRDRLDCRCQHQLDEF